MIDRRETHIDQSDPANTGHRLPEYLIGANVFPIWEFATHCAIWNGDVFAGIDIGGEARTHIAAAAFGLVHEHHGAVLHLLMDRRLGSALAMLRPCFETYVRGLWLVRGCDDAQFQHFVSGQDTKPVERLLTEITRKPDSVEDHFLHETWERSKTSLHMYTHTSFQLLLRRMDEHMVEESLQPEEVVNAIQFATATAMLASVELAKLATHVQHERRALRLLQRLYV